MDLPLSDLPEPIRSAVEALDSIAEPSMPDDVDLVWLQDPNLDKYTFETNVAIDCENRIHLCRAACCSMSFPLSLQDLREGVVAWDPGRPYAIASAANGACVHLDGACRCSIYAQRPLPCRMYDCRNDARIWSDFDARIPNPALHADRPPEAQQAPVDPMRVAEAAGRTPATASTSLADRGANDA